MPAEPLSPGQARTGEPDDTSIPQAGVPSERPQAPATVPSGVQHGIIFEMQAADPAETLWASREVPEPDSLGG